MARKPDWTRKEFEAVLKNPTLSSEALALQLPGRSVDSILLIRRGVHAFHTGRNTPMLSKLMLRQLQYKGNQIKCPVCGEMF